MKRAKIVLSVIVFVFILMVCANLVYYNLDVDEARQAMGETYELTDDWKLLSKDGKETVVQLPYTVLAQDAESIILEHDLSEDYAGLTMSFYAENVALRAMVDGNKIFESGYSKDMGRGLFGRLNQGKPDDQTVQNNVSFQAIGGETQEAGKVMIDLPNATTNAKIRIVMNRVSASRDVTIHEVTIAKRDITIIGILRKSIFPLTCCILIVIGLVVLIMTDVVRALTRRRTNEVLYMILFGFVMIIYSFVQTDILSVFFGNQKAFSVIEHICYVVMPIFLVLYYRKIHGTVYRKRTAVLLGVAVLMAVTELVLDYFFGVQLNQMSDYTLGFHTIIIGVLIHMLTQWSRDEHGAPKIWMDVAALCCVLIAVMTNPVQKRLTQSDVSNLVRILATTLCFFFLTIKHIRALLFEYRERVREDAKKLRDQIKLVESQNELLTQAKLDAEQARQEAVVANEAKGKFLANMSHEIRTPINAVLGMDEMILRESREKTIRNYAMDIYTAGQTLLALINDILDLSKIESGKMEIIPVEYDVCSMIHDLVNMISLRAKSKDLQFEVSVEKDLPSRLFGDDVRIRQILTNILTNAVKYTPDGTVWFRASGRREGEYEILHCEVEDTGIGIKEEDLPKLFEEFQRIEENRSRSIEGTGLGMNITVKMLALMDSHLQVDSVYGKGSKFYFDVKQKIVDETPMGDFETRLQHMSENYHYSKSFCAPDARILVVDDNSMNRKVFGSLLKATKIQVDEAASGAECLELVAKNHYDILFLDHMMPEMDGIETLHRIRKMTDFPCENTPIFVLTANAVTGAREKYLEEGFDGFLSKPIISDKLEQTIRDTLPDDMMREAEDEEENLPEHSSDTVPEDLPDIDGLDWSYAWLHLPDRELLETTIKDFYKILNTHADRLDEMYQGLPAEESMEAYRIQVHAMKSTAATIGITPLSGMARILEMAARDFREDRIRAVHTVFTQEWRSYREKLKGVFGLGEDEVSEDEKASFDPDVLKSLLEMIRLGMEDFDVDTVDGLMVQVGQYRYPDEIKGNLEKMESAITDLDDEVVTALVSDMVKQCDAYVGGTQE